MSTDSEAHSPGPTDPSERIIAIDALRGFALLGILVVNIWYFSMPIAGGIYPIGYGDFSGVNYGAWLFSHVFFEMKFVTLFTILFGAGIILFTENKEQRGDPVLSLHFRRTGWLLLIGLGHAYLLWYGDILVAYAISGILVVFARHWSPRKLLSVGLVMIAIPSLLYLGLGGTGVLFADDPGMGDFEAEVAQSVGIDDASIQSELETYRGSWTEQLDHRVPMAFTLQTVEFAFGNFWRVAGMMLIGMALFKTGILSNERSTRFYWQWVIGGALLGLSLILIGVAYREYVEWDLLHTLLLSSQLNYWGSIPLAVAYLSGIMLLSRAYPTGLITRAFAAVGKTAFSNYLLQTLLATSIFYGHGLGLFGHLTRVEQLGVVLLIWAIQIPLSMVWLRYFQFGPVEWVWRTLTYQTRQPLRRTDR